MSKIVYGIVDPNGGKLSGKGFSVSRLEDGAYEIVFTPGFSNLPAVTGSQVRFNRLDQSTLDSVVFPFVTADTATALTGTSDGNRQDREFSFIAIGE